MAKKRIAAVRFEATDKSRIYARVSHTRTGACTASGRCYHGRRRRPKR